MSIEGFSRKAPQEAGSEDFEASFGEIQRGPDTSDNFPGRKIFTFKKDGEYVMYALERSSDGELTGNTFTMSEKSDGDSWRNSQSIPGIDRSPDRFRVNATYQMHEPDLEKMEKLLKSRGIEI